MIFNDANKTVNVTKKAKQMIKQLEGACGGSSQVSYEVLALAIVGQYNNGGFDSEKLLFALIAKCANWYVDDENEDAPTFDEAYDALFSLVIQRVEISEWDRQNRLSWQVI